MNKLLTTFVILTIFSSINAEAQKMKSLFNGKDLKNWDIFIGTALKGFDDLKAKATPENTYSIVEQNGDKLIHISGKVNASIATKKEFENYHLRFEFKWGEDVYTTRNSGLLYHSYGPFGAGLGTWMSSIELQLKHESLGDAYMMADTYAQVNVTEVEKVKVYDANGKSLALGNNQPAGKAAAKMKNMEKPLGEWNVVDLYCLGQKTIHVINGEKVMECNNIGKLVDGKVIPLDKGRIQIQSEGGELFVRKVEIEKISKLPANL